MIHLKFHKPLQEKQVETEVDQPKLKKLIDQGERN